MAATFGVKAAAPLSFSAVVSGFVPGEPPVTPRSFSKSFNGVIENQGTIKSKSPSTFRGEPAIFFTKEEISLLSSPFRFALVGKFPHWRPTMDVIRKFFCSLDLKSLKSVGLLQDNHIIIFINHPEDYSRLLIKSTWYISGALMKLQKWSPVFFPSYESPVVPVWVAFPGLPIHFFDKSALFNIASIFGIPLKVDEPTANLTRPTVARVCIEMDVSKPRKGCFWIGSEKEGFWQEVVFENPPTFCGFCKRLGHEEFSCSIKNPDLKSKKKKEEEKIEKEEQISKEVVSKPTFHAAGLAVLSEKEVTPSKNQEAVDLEDGWKVQKSKKWKKKKFQSDVVVPLVSGAAPACLEVTESAQVVAPLVCSVGVQSRVVEPPLKSNTIPSNQVLCLTQPNPNNSSLGLQIRDQPLDHGASLSQPSDLFKKLSILNNKAGVLDVSGLNSQSSDQSKGVFSGDKSQPSIPVCLSENWQPLGHSEIGREISGKRVTCSGIKEPIFGEKICFHGERDKILGEKEKAFGGREFSGSPSLGGLHLPCEASGSCPLSLGPGEGGLGVGLPFGPNSLNGNCLVGEDILGPSSVNSSIVHGASFVGSSNLFLGGPELPSSSFSSSQLSVDNKFGPNATLEIISSGQIMNPNPDDDLSQAIFSRENEVALSLIHIKSPIFSSLRKHGISLNHSLQDAICDFLGLVAPTFYQNNDGMEFTWNFIHRRLISYLIKSKIKVTKKLRKAFQIYFTRVAKENQPTGLLENRLSDADLETSEYSDSS